MKTFIVGLLMLISTSSKSQIQIGGRVGTGFTNLENIDEHSKTFIWKQGLYAGLFVNYKINQSLYIQPELNISSEGGLRKEVQQVPVGTINIPGSSEQVIYANLKTSTLIKYLEVPVLAKLTVGNKLKYHFCMGPYISFLLDAQRKAGGNSIVYLDKNATIAMKQNDPLAPVVTADFNYEKNIKDEIKNVNVGFMSGCGIELVVGRGAFLVEGRMKLGLSNIDAGSSSNGKHQTTSLSMSAGYMFSFK